MGKNKNEKKSPAVKKVPLQGIDANNNAALNNGDSKVGTLKQDEGSKMKSKGK